MHIPGLHRGHQTIAELLSRQNHKFIAERIPLYPFPVRLIQPGRPVGRIKRIIFIFMKPCFPTAKVNNHQNLQNKQCGKCRRPFLSSPFRRFHAGFPFFSSSGPQTSACFLASFYAFSHFPALPFRPVIRPRCHFTASCPVSIRLLHYFRFSHFSGFSIFFRLAPF